MSTYFLPSRLSLLIQLLLSRITHKWCIAHRKLHLVETCPVQWGTFLFGSKLRLTVLILCFIDHGIHRVRILYSHARHSPQTAHPTASITIWSLISLFVYLEYLGTFCLTSTTHAYLHLDDILLPHSLFDDIPLMKSHLRPSNLTN